MTEREVKSFRELVRVIAKDARTRERAVQRAARKAASKGRQVVKKNVPVAHGEVRESVHTEGPSIVVDAPHAAAVNNGSRPHTPPLQPLIEWVRMRGMQGLMTDRQIGRLPGTTTSGAARGVAAMLREYEVRGPGGYSMVGADAEVARAIQFAIASRGTKPSHFIEKSIPELRAILGDELRGAINTSQSNEGGRLGRP